MYQIFFLILLFFKTLLPSEILARQTFEFGGKGNVRVLSDKAYRKSKGNQFEAVGNVIITQKSNSIYGEKAKISFSKGITEVIGNVRYVGPQLTMYGSEISYNFRDEKFEIYNGKILSDNYVVLAKKFKRISEKRIIAKDAEYTTCKDCPESWSVFGREIDITVGEYVRISGAYFKIKGVVVMYVPLVIFPIKKQRESGLLFPKFSLRYQEGARFQQPYFWAINPQMDITMTPSYFGRRGYGGEFEFRHTVRDGLWYQFDGLFANDGIYLPGKIDREKSGDKQFRFLGQWEHHYFNGESINHHFNLTNSRDHDFLRDYEFYGNDKILGPDVGVESFLEFKKDSFFLGLEAGLRENQLFREARDFDNRYVQILPKISLSINSINLIKTKIPFLNDVSLGLDSDLTIFKQNNISEENFIRNAHRINTRPYIDWNFGNFGPVNVKTRIRFDHQYYNFPTLENNNWFRKNAIVYETEGALFLDKIYGLSYMEVYNEDEIKRKEKAQNEESKSNIIGSLPNISSNKDTFIISKNSYKHSQNIKLKHYYLSDTKAAGNDRFYDQIIDDNGQFDTFDTIRSREFEANNLISRTSLPLDNTIEIQWNNNLIKKVARDTDILEDNRELRESFDYQSIAHFKVSQGYILSNGLPFEKRLTRLLIDAGLSFRNSSINLSEAYFYTTKENILNARYTYNFSIGSLSTGLRYSSFRIPPDQLLTAAGSLNLTNRIKVSASIIRDLGGKRTNQIIYGMLFSPSNNCWRLQLDYLKTIAEKRIGVNFLINWGDNMFTGAKQE